MARAANNGQGRKYFVCNADEGDPGAYMDRSLLEGNPHAIIEGMLIAGVAIGATKGIIYVRSEYPLAIKHALIADAASLATHVAGYLSDEAGRQAVGAEAAAVVERNRGATVRLLELLSAEIQAATGRPAA